MAKVGHYDPMPEKEVIHLETEAINEWIKKGAQPTEAVRALIRRAARCPGGAPTVAKPEPIAEAVGTPAQEDSGSAEAQPEA